MKSFIRRYKFEIFPSPIQMRWLAQIFGAVRFVFNEILRINDELWFDDENGGDRRMFKKEAQSILTVWRDALPWLKKIPSQSLQVATHDLDVAYQNFTDGRASKPKRKKKKSRQSFQIPQPKMKMVSGQMCIFIPNFQTWIPIRMHRDLPQGAKIGAATITKTPSGRYFVSFVVKFSSKEAISSASSEMVGVDLNVKEIVLSDGEKIATPQIMKTLEARKRRLQKKMQRQRDRQAKDGRENRSNNYEKTRIQLAKVHEKIKNQSEDFLHKLALKIYRKNQAVAMETLNVKGMMKNRKLAKSIAFQSWGRFVEIMKMYAIQYDKQLHFISMWFPSSKMCHKCGFVNQKLKLSHREWDCESCGAHHDRDINAAINIKNEGGSYPVYKPVERKAPVKRPKRGTSMASAKQESSRFEVAS